MRSIPIVILALLFAKPLLAQPVPNFTSASVDTVPAGKSIDVTLTGDHIWNATGVHLAGGPGVSVRIHPPTTQPTKDKPLRELRLRLSATQDAPRGPRELRLITPSGITRPLQITVDDYDPIAETEPNNDPDKPQEVTLPAILVGTITGGADIDTFRFAARKGQRMIFDVFANRIGSKLDSTLRLFDERGREITRDEDTAGLDSLIDLEIPHDGVYTLMIHDLRYQGGADYNYRIRAGEIPYVRSIFPLGGQRGQSVSIELAGRNLARPKMDMTLSSAMPLGRMDIHASTPRGVSNSHTFEVGNLPEFFEHEPNDDVKHANPTTMPTVINGRLHKAGDADTYRIRPAAPNTVAEIFAQRYGSDLDALLTLRDANGSIIARNDDAGPGTADARITFPAPNQDYFLTVADLHGYGGDDYGYRLQLAAAAKEEPDFDLLFSPDAPRVGRGGHMKLWCFARRKGGLDADITVKLDNLPRGVACEPLVIGKAAGSGLLVISAAKDAPLGFHPLTLTATATTKDDKTITRSLTPRGVARSAPPVYLTVLPEPPFRIARLGDPTFNDPRAIKAEIAYLQEKLSTPTPELTSKLAAWEADQMTRLQWHPIEVEAVRNAPLAKQPDGSLLAGGNPPAKVTYNIVGHTKLKRITAIKLEAYADDGKGPGRATDGNFVLSKFVAQAIVEGQGKDAETLEFNKPTASFSQGDYNIESTLGPVQDKTGWAIFPQTSQSHWAIWPLKKPLENQGGNLRLSFDLYHQWNGPAYVLRRFRLLVTDAENAPGGFSLPDNVLATLLTPKDKRTEAQTTALLAHYRSIAPESADDRARLALLKGAQDPFPPKVIGNREGSILVTIDRNNFEGDVTLTLEGWTNNIDPKKLEPLPIANNLDLKPMVLKGKDTRGAVKFTTSPRTERATRTVVVRADAQVNGILYTQYSPLIPLTVADPPKPEEKK